MLSSDLAKLYGVERRALLQAVKRNRRRFPADFMFQLTRAEQANLKSQSVISSSAHGVAMLSSVLRSAKAIDVNIKIVRAFVQLRHFVLGNKNSRDDSPRWRRSTTGSSRRSSSRSMN